MPKLEIAVSKTHSRPHFAGHTQSSLMKRRTPMKLKKSSSIKNVNGLKKSQESVLKLNGIYKRRSSVIKQSKSMQMLIMVLKQQRDRRATVFFPGSELTETTCKLENSIVSFQSDLIQDVSRDLKKCANSPAKLAILRGKSTKVNESESFSTEDLHAFPQDRNCAGRDNSEDIRDSHENRTIVNVSYKQLSDKEKTVDSHCEVEDVHRRTESEEKPNDFPNKDCSEIATQIHPQSVNVETTNRKRTRKTWTYRKVEIRNEHVNLDVCHTDLQGSKSTKFTKHIDNRRDKMSANDRPVVNSDATIRKRGAFQKNLPSNQRAWRPPGVPKTWTTESAMSLQPISQKKSSQSVEKSSILMKNKLSSTEQIDFRSFNSESTSSSISSNQSKMLMKENRDPRANRMTKICEHLTQAKQRQRLQSGGTLPKKRWSRTKIDSKVSDKRDDTNSTLSKSKSRHCQTRLIMPKEFSNNSNNNEQHRTESTLIYSKSRTLEVIHTLKKIIDNVRENEDAEENTVKNNGFDHKKNDSEIQTSPPDSDTLQNNELSIFMEDVNLNDGDRVSRKSSSTQTELNSSLYHKIDAEKDQDLEEILKLTRIVATQTLPSCNKNVVEIGCSTSNVVCNDIEVSCDLIGSTNLKAEIDLTMVKDKSPSDVLIHTEPSSVEHIEINVENENTNENKELLLNRCKTTLNTEMSLKVENCDSVKIPAKMTNDAAGEAEKIMHEEDCQISLKSSKNSKKLNINKNPELIKRFNNHNVNSTSINNLFLKRSRSSVYDYDASCSSEEVAEYLENDVQYEDMVASELKMEDIPSDVIAAFELAAERARNLHEAVIIYHKNLMSRESGKRNEETIEDYETSKFRDKQNCFGRYASFINRENEDKIKFESEAVCHFANNGEDFGGFSTCSSRGSSSDLMCGSEFPRSSRDDLFGREKESAVLSRSEQAIARSMLNKRCDLEDVKSLMQLLVQRTQEEYALELLQLERNDENFEMERMKNDKTLAFSAAIKRTSLISRENLVPLVYCIICTVVFWYLQFSFRCDSK